MNLLRTVAAALGQPPRRATRHGESTGYQRRLLPDVAAGRVLLNHDTLTAWRLPPNGAAEDVSADCTALRAAGLIVAPPPLDDPEVAQVVLYELTSLGEDTLVASRRRKEPR